VIAPGSMVMSRKVLSMTLNPYWRSS